MIDWAAVIRRISPRASNKIVTGLAESMPRLIEIADLKTRLRQAHFLAQLAHESAGFTTTEEFASGSAYEGRKDLGNVQPGDGKRFKGRGLIQLTGRANYKRMSSLLGVDFVSNPMLAAQFPHAALTSALFWREHRLNNHADDDNINSITRAINGGHNGLSDRKKYLARAKAELNDMKLAQKRLTDLNYAAGRPDGVPGPLTRSALRDFQDANGLPITGQLDDKTAKKLFAPDATVRPVSKEREVLTVADLREGGSKIIKASDDTKFGAIGAALATASGVASQAKEVAGQIDDIKTGIASGASVVEVARDYWPAIVIVLAGVAAAYFLWRAYRGAKQVEAERVANARTGVNVRL